MSILGKALFLSVAGFVTGASAQAADLLPSGKAGAADYVKVCNAFGAGFFYIPGTDTCLHVGGYVRAEYAYVQPANLLTTPIFSAGPVAPTATSANTTFVPGSTEDVSGYMMRGRIELDARTATSWGTVRTYISIRGQNASSVYSGFDNYQTNVFTGVGAGASISLENALVQFAGFSFGHTPADILSFLPGFAYEPLPAYGSGGGFNLLAYTLALDGGFSATVGLEERGGQSYPNIPGYVPALGSAIAAQPANAGAPSTGGGFIVNGPYTWPALDANLRLEQSWGALQLGAGVLQDSAAANMIQVSGNGSTVANGLPVAGSNSFIKQATGYGATLGLRLNLPTLGPNDVLYLNGAVARGYLDILGYQNTTTVTNDTGRLLDGLQRIDRDLYVVPRAACALAATEPECFTTAQSKGWSVAGVLVHYWSPTIHSVLLGSLEQITPPAPVRNLDWTLGGLSRVAVARVNVQPLVWNPTPGLEIGQEFSYNHIQQRFTGANGAAPTACPLSWPNCHASATALESRLRITRQF